MQLLCWGRPPALSTGWPGVPQGAGVFRGGGCGGDGGEGVSCRERSKVLA